MSENNAWVSAINMDGSSVDQAAYSIGKQRLWRKGKWTDEEERYTKRLVSAFNQGLLPLQVGTTLRCFLSDKLNCDPMRISKKFAGSSSIGKQVYAPCDPSPMTMELMKAAQDELLLLESSFLAKVEVSEKPFMYPTPHQPPMWYQGNAIPPFVYGVPTEYMPAMVMGVPFNGIPEVVSPADMYMHVGMGIPQQVVPMPIPLVNNIPLRPPPPEPKEPRRNFVVPEMKQIQEAKQVLESKPEVKETELKEAETKQIYVAPTSSLLAETMSDLSAPPVVAEARDGSSLATQSQERQQPEILEIPPLTQEPNAPRAQPKYNMAHKKTARLTATNHTGTDASDSDLLINFFKAANDRDSVETQSDSSSNNSNSKSLERKSDSTHMNSGSEEKSSTESSNNSSGNSGSDGDNSSQEEESSGTQDKSESSSQEGDHRSRQGRAKENDQATSAPTSMRPQYPHNRRFFHSPQPNMQSMAPYPGYPPTYFHHGPTPYSPYPAPGLAQYPQMPMQPMAGQYGMYPAAIGVVNPQIQQQETMVRSKSGGYHRPRTASSSGSVTSSSTSSGSESGPPNGTVVDTPKGPMLIWHEVNNMGTLVEKTVPFAFMAAPYRAGKERSSNATKLTEEQLKALQLARSRGGERTERRNIDTSNSNKRLRTADGGNKTNHMDSSEMTLSSSPT